MDERAAHEGGSSPSSHTFSTLSLTSFPLATSGVIVKQVFFIDKALGLRAQFPFPIALYKQSKWWWCSESDSTGRKARLLVLLESIVGSARAMSSVSPSSAPVVDHGRQHYTQGWIWGETGLYQLLIQPLLL